MTLKFIICGSYTNQVWPPWFSSTRYHWPETGTVGFARCVREGAQRMTSIRKEPHSLGKLNVCCALHLQAWMNEKFSPELLESKSEVVECVVEQLEHMVPTLQEAPCPSHPPSVPQPCFKEALLRIRGCRACLQSCITYS